MWYRCSHDHASDTGIYVESGELVLVLVKHFWSWQIREMSNTIQPPQIGVSSSTSAGVIQPGQVVRNVMTGPERILSGVVDDVSSLLSGRSVRSLFQPRWIGGGPLLGVSPNADERWRPGVLMGSHTGSGTGGRNFSEVSAGVSTVQSQDGTDVQRGCPRCGLKQKRSFLQSDGVQCVSCVRGGEADSWWCWKCGTAVQFPDGLSTHFIYGFGNCRCGSQ